MSAYNRLHGVPISASKYFLTDLLRNKWGFNGFVVSDCGAVDDIYYGHKYTSSLEEAAALAVKAGCELNCGNSYKQLTEAMNKGFITEKDIDVAVERLMEARIRLGMFDPENAVPFNNIPLSVNDSPQHRQLSIIAAQESMVLLKNENNILPLNKNIKTIAVIGPNADSPEVMYGNYNGTPSRYTTPLQGIKNKVSTNTKVLYALGTDCVGGQAIPEVIPFNCLFSDDIHGLKGEYFSNLNLEGVPALTRIDSTIDFNWDGKVPVKDFSVVDYSARWSGYLIAPETGKYKLSVTGDDGFRLFLDDSLVISNWLEHAPVTESYYVDLKKGGKHKVRLEYFQKDGGASIRFAWYIDKKNLVQEAVEIANKSDVIIYVGGISPLLEGEEMSVPFEGFSGGDRTSIDLPVVQRKLLKELKATGKPIVFVMLNGSAIAINWENENIPAILEAWYPGQEGGTAIANILFGDYNPAGRLPVTFYKSVDQLPPFDDYNMKGRTYRYFEGEPLYPFGYGLSYTSFSYSDLKVNNNPKTNEILSVKVKVKNMGEKDGDEVAQMYVKHINTNFPVPIYSLEGFKRIHLKKGEEKFIEFNLSPENLSVVIDGNKQAVVPGEIELFIGGMQPPKSETEKQENIAVKIKLEGVNYFIE